MNPDNPNLQMPEENNSIPSFQNSQLPDQNFSKPSDPESKSKIIPIMLVTLVAMIIAATGLFLFLKEPESDTTTIDTQKKELKEVTVKLKWKHNAQFAGMYYAQENGIYAEKGLNVKFEEWTPERGSATQIVSDKEADFGVSTGVDIITGNADKGRNTVGVATIFQHDPEGFIALESSGIKELKDAAGKKIGLFPGKTTLVWEAMLKAQGLEDMEYTVVNMDFSTLPTPDYNVLRDKTVDVYATFMNDQGVQLAKALEDESIDDSVVNLNPYDYGVKNYNDTIITHPDTIASNPQLVQDFVDATIDGWKEALKNPEAAVSATNVYAGEDYAPFSEAIFAAQVPFVLTNDDPLLWSDASVWSDMYRLLSQNSALTNTIDVTKVFDTSFVRSYYGAN